MQEIELELIASDGNIFEQYYENKIRDEFRQIAD